MPPSAPGRRVTPKTTAYVHFCCRHTAAVADLLANCSSLAARSPNGNSGGTDAEMGPATGGRAPLFNSGCQPTTAAHVAIGVRLVTQTTSGHPALDPAERAEADQAEQGRAGDGDDGYAGVDLPDDAVRPDWFDNHRSHVNYTV